MSLRFDVAFSFAGPHREKVRAIAEIISKAIDPGLKNRSKGRVFFDEWFEHELLGDDMDVLLQRFYYEESLMVVADLSDDYGDRQWCQAEARAIRALRFEVDPARDETRRLRLLDARFGNGTVPGIFNTTAYLDGIKKDVTQCADVILNRLDLLRERLGNSTPVLNAVPPSAANADATKPPICFFHPATNDDRYSRREHELAWLDQCARNPDIRIATVTGQGGLGKTSLVGHWIEKRHGWQYRAFRGVFFYSFYSNRDPKGFFDAFLDFVCKNENAELPNETPLHHLAASACRKWRYLVVLDGLEVLQHGEEDPHYGWIADGELTEFVARVGAEGASLLVLTSRFPFPRITDEHPAAARALELPLFINAEGADLLAVCGLTDPRPRLEGYSELLGGHPLALRIFAGACLEQPFDDPEKVSRDVRSSKGVESMPDPDEPGLDLEEKQKRRQRRQFYKLLRWFQQKLSPPKRRLLQLVTLFRDPVRTETLRALALGLDVTKADFAGCDVARIAGLLDQLSGQFLLQKETSAADDAIRWTAHPIVRDVFREAALSASDTVAKQFAEIVAGKDEWKTPKTVAEVLPIVEAIEVLLAAGDFKAADELYHDRLENGYVFLYVPAPEEGLRCARAFLEPEERSRLLKKMLSQGRVGFYLNEVALFAGILGQVKEADDGHRKAAKVTHTEREWSNVSADLRNIGVNQMECGNLRKAIIWETEALFYAGVTESLSTDAIVFLRRPSHAPPHDEKAERRSLVYRAHILSLLGRLNAASRDFAIADMMERKQDIENEGLYARYNILWWRHRFRVGELHAAKRFTEANRIRCKGNDWNSDLAHCDNFLGELNLLVGDLTSAERYIAEARRIFRDARQGVDLPDALLAMARVHWAFQSEQKDTGRIPTRPMKSSSALPSDESALSYCEESLRLAARSGFLLKKCDALNFRALLLRESGQPLKALADAREAHDIASRCEYYWGLHEALRQLRDTATALNRTAEFREWDKAERDLTEKMKPEIAEALRINREHDAEIEKLYGKEKK